MKGLVVAEYKVRRPGDISQLIAALRNDQGLRQEDLALRAGISREYLANLETGKPTTYMVRLFKLMRILGITMTLSYEVQGSNKSVEEEDAGETRAA